MWFVVNRSHAAVKIYCNYHCICFFTMIKYLCIVEQKSEDSLVVSFGNNRRRKCSMNTLEVLTLVLVIFAALWKAIHNNAYV